MKVLAVTLISLSLLASVASQAQTSAAQADAPPPVLAQDSGALNRQLKGPASTSLAQYRLSRFFLRMIHRA